jgi:hypothetical protein
MRAGSGEVQAVEHLEAKYRKAASSEAIFPSYDVNSGLGCDQSQQAP